ncbi:RhoGAP domain [Popillia japonica]|uniref:RhoGAP domain n=1 Tax=Popillia japonica TaxID=7064 RepID=A0AAW1L8L9_POPJA
MLIQTFINIYRFFKKQIIGDKSLNAVLVVIEHLKENARNRDLFRISRHDGRIKQIANEIHKGGRGLEKLLEDCTIREIASGLQYFLLNLKKPLMPTYVQSLALTDSPGVAPELIAQDILGLLKQELAANHLVLLIAVLDLLHHSLRCSPADELAGSSVPISMLPIFFNMQAEHISHWRRVAMIFMEIIRFSPSYFQIDTEEYNDSGLPNFAHQNRGVNNALLQQRLLEMNVVLRRYIIRQGNRGDCCDFEAYQPRAPTHLRRHTRLHF